MTAVVEIEREVARRFDAEQGRFKTEICIDDYRLVAVQDVLGDLRGLRILDLGCGKGRFAARLQSAGAIVVGVDVSNEMLAHAPVPRVKATMSRLPFRDAAFDAAIAVETLQHVAALAAALSEAARVLTPRGRIVIVDKHDGALNVHRPWLPNRLVKWIDDRRGRGMYGAGSKAVERWRSDAAMRRGLAEAGFVDLDSYGLLSREEAKLAVFRRFEQARAMRLWTAVRPKVAT